MITRTTNMSTKLRVIGITGRKFNGKDTVGEYLVKEHGYMRLAFADPLKEASRCIFNFSNEQLYGSLKETTDDFWKTSPRIVLQYLGTELFRDQLAPIMPHVGKNIWVEVTRRKMLDIWKENPDQKFVITDVRFQNELDFIKEYGGTTAKVLRSCVNKLNDSHASECESDKLTVDQCISNDGTLADLYNNVNKLINKSI